MSLWSKIDKQLKKRNKTVYWLSKQTGISENMFYALKKGRANDLGFSKVEKVSDALDVDINEFREEG